MLSGWFNHVLEKHHPDATPDDLRIALAPSKPTRRPYNPPKVSTRAGPKTFEEIQQLFAGTRGDPGPDRALSSLNSYRRRNNLADDEYDEKSWRDEHDE